VCSSDLLKQSEQSWLRYMKKVCTIDKHSKKMRIIRMKEEYQKRLKQLSEVGKKIGPFIFNRIDFFSAKVSKPADQTGSMVGFATQHVGYPQIDNANNKNTKYWNDNVVKKLPIEGPCESDGDYDIDYVIGYANDKLISIQWSNSFYCHQTPHGQGEVKNENIVLLPVPHNLVPNDLFGPGDNWNPKLQNFFWDALKQQGWTPQDDEAKTGILSAVIQPDRWLITNKGIEVAFSAYEGGCYACTPGPVTVSWDKIQTLLSQKSIFQPITIKK
jgi:hypothetical protein